MLAAIKKTSRRFQEPLTFVIKSVLILSIINSTYLGFWHIMSANIMLLILLFLPKIMRSSYRLKFPKEFELLLLLFVIATFFTGTIIKGAIVPIFFGISVSFIGFIVLLILYTNDKIRKDSGLIFLIVISFSIAFGFSVELAKYILKSILGFSLGSGDYTYMMKNMLFVIFGAIISSGFGLLYMYKHRGAIQKAMEKFRKINPKLFPSKINPAKEMKKVIEKGETERVEFKSTLRMNLYTKKIDKRIEHSVLKTIAAFLNSKGGKLYIGISDKGEIVGIEKDAFENEDRFFLHLANLVKQRLGKNSLSRINTRLISIENKKIAEITCKKSKKEIFLKSERGEEFYIRSGPSSTPISGKDLIEYIERHFRK